MNEAAHELAALLRSLFEPGELREWLHHREGFEFFLNLPADDGALAEAAAASLERHARLNIDFFHALLGSRPHRVEQIARVAGRCGVAPDPGVVEAARVKAKDLPPEPAFAGEDGRVLSEGLDALYREREERIIAGQPTVELDARILEMRRELRHGPRLHPGEFLDGGRYRLLEQVGQGGYGAVWRAYDRESRGLVAIKVLHGHWSGERERRERFFRGALRMAELNHPAVVRVLRPQLEDHGFFAFVMELVTGGDLHDAVREGRLDARAALEKVLRVGEALAYAHSRGLVHRDIKPHNVLLDGAGQPKLCDFDLVKDLDYSGSHTGGAMGTWVYASPELRRDAKHVDARADVYGLAMTAVFCVFRADLPHEAVYDPVDFVAHLTASSALRAVLARAVQPDPERRTPSVTELCEALGKALDAPDRAPDRAERVAELERLLLAGDDEFRVLRLGTELALQMSLQPGDVVADATLVERTGEGFSAVVWRGTRLDDGQPVAVRVIRAEVLTVGQVLPAFRRGYELLRSINGKNGLEWFFPRVYGRSDDGLAYTMDLVIGGQPGSPLATLQAVAEALTQLDGATAGCCDLRPHNLRWSAEGRVGLMDFDPPDPAEPGAALWIPPEGGAPGWYAAVYRFGQLARALLSGGSANANDPWLDSLASQPKALQELVWECLREDPKARPSMSEILTRLREAREPSPAPRGDSGPADESPWTGWRSLLAAAAVLLVVGGGAYFWPTPVDVTVSPTARYLALSAEVSQAAAQRDEDLARRELLTEQLGRLEDHVSEVNATVAVADPAEAEPLRAVLGQREAELALLRDEVRTLNSELDSRQVLVQQGVAQAQALRDEAIAAGAPATELPPVRVEAPTFTPPPPPRRGEATHVGLRPAPMPFMEITPGSYEMGSGAADSAVHRVALSGFLVANDPVTRQQWELVLGPRGKTLVPDPTLPRVGMSWCDALRYANRLSIRDGLTPVYDNVPEQGCERPERVRWNRTARGYRLPTEAEWEAAARFLTPAGPEWVWDAYDPEYFAVSPPRDPRGPALGRERVTRAGPERGHAPPGEPPEQVRLRLVLDTGKL